MYENIAELAARLVAVPSMNGTPGEAKIAQLIEEMLREIPYFRQNPDGVFTQVLPGDALGRRNVFALLKGGRAQDGATVILHGHMDTVGVDDFGLLKPYAFSCDRLREELLQRKDELDPELRRDLESGDWMFGRGVGDMKSGVAVWISVLAALSGRAESLPVNVLFMSNPVEENLHTGVIASLEVLQKLQAQGLRFLYAVNSDCVTPLYPGDQTRYAYLGAIGKTLPCFYLLGGGKNVGAAAAQLVCDINLNPACCDGGPSETTPPPSVLKLRCERDEAFLYFNFMVTDRSTSEVLALLGETAARAFREVGLSGGSVYEYGEICALAREKHPQDFDRLEREWSGHFAAEIPDKREAGLSLVREVVRLSGIGGPAAILFFAAPYCPHNTLSSTVPREQELREKLEKLLRKTGLQTGETFSVLKFFACLSDSSYLKIDDDPPAIEALKRNFPAMKQLYDVPVDAIKKMNIPAVNLGVFMKDPHQWTERVYCPYTFGVLPKLVMELIETAGPRV